MTAIPAAFRAFVAVTEGDGVTRGAVPFVEADLAPGEVEVRVAWSSVNYKDGLATIPQGKVARMSPLIPGIDLAGEVIASEDPTTGRSASPRSPGPGPHQPEPAQRMGCFPRQLSPR